MSPLAATASTKPDGRDTPTNPPAQGEVNGAYSNGATGTAEDMDPPMQV